MRYAVVSDVHGNLEALEAAFARIAPSDGLLCLGDIVGYGPNPNECVAMIRERATATVLGNHDVAAIDSFGLEYFNDAARTALEWTQGVIEVDHVTWLNSLGYEFRTADFLLVHGAPKTYFTYVLSRVAAQQAFDCTDAPLIFIGHTHIAEYYALRPDGSLEHHAWQHGGALALEDGTRYLVNPGSIGQPRDANPQASFALYDPVAKTIDVQRVAYPIERVQAKIAAANLPESLARRLAVGR